MKSPERRHTTCLNACLVLIVALVYIRSLGNDFVNWDDALLVYKNPAVTHFSWKSLAWSFTHFDPELYIPLTFLSYQLEHLLFGLNPFFFHLTSLLLHIGNTVCVFVLLRLLSKHTGIAFGGALAFGIHPLNTEAVAWVSGRKDILSALFFFLALITYLRYRESGSMRLYAWSIAVFLFGLLSKVMVATLPLVLLLVDAIQKRRFGKGAWLEKIPYFLLAMVFGVVALIGKANLLVTASPEATILMGIKASVFYIQKLLLPTKLSVLYPFREEIALGSPNFWIPLAILLFIVLIVLWTLRYTRGIACGFAFYLVTVAITFTNFTKGGPLDQYFASDRYAYIPSVGIFYLSGLALLWLWERRRISPLFRWTNVAAGALIATTLVAFAVRAHTRSLDWRDSETLYTANLRTYPDSYIVQNNLGSIYLDRGEVDRAIAMFERAIELHPTHPRAYANLGAAYGRKGMYEKGLTYLFKSWELDPSRQETPEELRGFLKRRDKAGL